MAKTQGFLAIVLHAHLPFVKHPESEDSLEERWLFQAITECYIPLLECFGRLVRDGVPFRASVSLSPPLLEMFSDPLLRERYKKYLLILAELGEKEMDRTREDSRFSSLARSYRDRFLETHRLFCDVYREDLTEAWRDLANEGRIEFLTSAATHGYLPLLLSPKAVGAQVRTGFLAFRRHLGREPQGFWLPECAYMPEVEPFLREGGVTYFMLETHGVLLATPRPKYGFHAPLVTPGGILAFGRDPDCSKQVWSADEGYPGDGDYRDFYRDAGYDLPVDYLGRALPNGSRVPTGFKYYRVTHRRSLHKEVYDPKAAHEKAKAHAANFLFWRSKESSHYHGVLGRAPIMVAPYDAELFGHWWYEGPLFLEELLRLTARGESGVVAVSPSDYLQHYPVNQIAQPAPSSWGYKGYNEVWLESSNDWIYPHLHFCGEEMASVAERHRDATGLARRALNQAGRELLLAQSSDWPFIMKAGSVPDYAKGRFVTHIGRFRRLIEEIEKGAVDPVFLREVERKDSIFSGLDLTTCWQGTEKPA